MSDCISPTAKPILLDLFCRAGGCTKGYQDAGFYVVGVDIEPQPNYCGDEFYQADALEFMTKLIKRLWIPPQNLFSYTDGYQLKDFAAIHASPPCQAFSALRNLRNQKEHVNLIPQTRALLKAAGKPYIIENVPGAPLKACLTLCGSMFGLQTDCGAELRRHRLFETNWFSGDVPKCNHGHSRPIVICVAGDHPRDGSEFTLRAAPQRAKGKQPSNVISITGHSAEIKSTISVHGDHARRGEASAKRKRLLTITGHSAQTNVRERVVTVTGSTPQQDEEHNRVRECFSMEQARKAMGISWMAMKDLSQAIPPAYTQFIGRRLMEQLSSTERVVLR